MLVVETSAASLIGLSKYLKKTKQPQVEDLRTTLSTGWAANRPLFFCIQRAYTKASLACFTYGFSHHFFRHESMAGFCFLASRFLLFDICHKNAGFWDSLHRHLVRTFIFSL